MLAPIALPYRFDPRIFAQGNRAQREIALDVLAAALAAVDPTSAVRAALRREGDILHVGERSYDLRRYQRVLCVGGGKAGASMALAVEEVLGDRLAAGAVNVKYGHTAPLRVVQLTEAGHPIPDEAGVRGTRAMIELLRGAGEGDLVIAVISGGGSALIEAPVEGVTLADVQRLTELMLRSGATINEMNAVRKHLSQVKGGRLAALAAPAELITLLLSDVVGSPLDVIASGPTVPDTSTFADAAAVFDRYGLWEQAPTSIVAELRAGLAGDRPETPKPGDPLFERTNNLVVASNEQAAAAAVERARAHGLNALLLSTFVEGEAREVAKVLAAIAREERRSGQPLPRPACIVLGGETTVTVRGNGKGGRNQEMALAAAFRLAGLEDVLVVCAATDGTDGPTDAGGAVADGTTIARARALGLDPARALAENDAYPLLAALGDLILTGPTNTNVNDLALVFAF